MTYAYLVFVEIQSFCLEYERAPQRIAAPTKFFHRRGCIHALFFLLRMPQTQKAGAKAEPYHRRRVILAGNKIQHRSKKKQQSAEIKQVAFLHSPSLRFWFFHRLFWIRQAQERLSFYSACKGGKVPARHAESMCPQQSAGQIHEGWLACLPMET
ncbi:hypothetical protein [uncultured Faecalibacterium sp.]|uniref:hypothetical protein n=1 Tax=uncultured Faecalibacterium sp. TaxID=259315 RepID=UPI0028058D85|nr:hypothetical protein [uncultured Faecalibacterium sp.]